MKYPIYLCDLSPVACPYAFCGMCDGCKPIGYHDTDTDIPDNYDDDDNSDNF